jgi:Arc/MetJ-type ribon-helix-helix transcriptional regulator
MATRTTVVLDEEDERALREASKREGVSQSELIRRGIRMVTAAHRRGRGPTTGWLELDGDERREVDGEDFGDPDA